MSWRVDWHWFRDCFWVLADPVSNEDVRGARTRDENERKKAADVGDSQVLAAIESADQLCEQEVDRARSLDARLGGLLGMASVVLAVFAAISALTGAAKPGCARVHSLGLLASAVPQILAALQLLRALWCAVHGLSLRGVSALTMHDELADPGESDQAHRKRRLEARMKVAQSRREASDDKATQLNLAYRSLINAFAFLLLTLLAYALRLMV